MTTTRNSRNQPATIRTAGPVQLPLSRRRRRRRPAPVKDWTGHQILSGDTLAVMRWERNAYAVVTVTEVLFRGEVTVREEFDGTSSTMSWSALMASAGQAYAHFGQDQAQDPHVGRIVRADGTVHHITTAGYCLQCH